MSAPLPFLRPSPSLSLCVVTEVPSPSPPASVGDPDDDEEVAPVEHRPASVDLSVHGAIAVCFAGIAASFCATLPA